MVLGLVENFTTMDSSLLNLFFYLFALFRIELLKKKEVIKYRRMRDNVPSHF